MPESELYVDDDALLNGFLDELAHIDSIPLDTEFVREKTYYPQLCLIQIAAGDSIACIDCLADIDLGALYDSLLRDECTWIVHSCRQDLEVIFQHTQRLPSTLIDTQIAAGLVGYAPQISLQDIVADMLGVELDKSHTRTDWSRRPLPSAAIQYAGDDVRSLHALWDALAVKLDALGRREWLEQDCALLLTQNPVTPVDQVFTRLRGARSLDTHGQRAALRWSSGVRNAHERATDRGAGYSAMSSSSASREHARTPSLRSPQRTCRRNSPRMPAAKSSLRSSAPRRRTICSGSSSSAVRKNLTRPSYGIFRPAPRRAPWSSAYLLKFSQRNKTSSICYWAAKRPASAKPGGPGS